MLPELPWSKLTEIVIQLAPPFPLITCSRQGAWMVLHKVLLNVNLPNLDQVFYFYYRFFSTFPP